MMKKEINNKGRSTAGEPIQSICVKHLDLIESLLKIRDTRGEEEVVESLSKLIRVQPEEQGIRTASLLANCMISIKENQDYIEELAMEVSVEDCIVKILNSGFNLKTTFFELAILLNIVRKEEKEKGKEKERGINVISQDPTIPGFWSVGSVHFSM